jgi:hypothetical protein
MTAISHSGGCQCGAIRFRASRFGRSSICHCRMCQKAFGGIFGALVTAYDLEWMECGTPLTFETGGPIEIAVGAFDDPSVVRPTIQLNPTDKVAFFEDICTLPMRPDGAEPKAEAFKASVISFQHPDNDTVEWPTGDGR